MPTSLVHENVIFEDQTIHLTGNAYIDCTFRRCNFVVSGLPIVLRGCVANACVWHIDLVFSDVKRWKAFVEQIAPMISDSLPAVPYQKGNRKRQKTKS